MIAKGVDDISARVSEQKASSHDIARNVEAIAGMAEENSEAVGKSASDAHRMSERALRLREVVRRSRIE